MVGIKCIMLGNKLNILVKSDLINGLMIDNLQGLKISNKAEPE